MKAFGMVAVVIVTIVFASMVPASIQMVPGGLHDAEPANDEVKGYIKELEAAIKASPAVKKSGVDTNAPIEALSMKIQMVAGRNYFVKVRIADKHFHVQIYKHFVDKARLSETKGPVKLSDPLD